VVSRFTFTPADGVPAPVAPYAHATAAGGLLCITGQLPVDAGSGLLVGDDIAVQTDQVLRNLLRVLELCDAGIEQVMHARAYITSMDLYAAFNAAYEAWFPPGELPARTCVAVDGLALGALVEIDLLVAR
jgi:2-iminobutanoate/2-iminopropanoate deaminase